VQTRQNWMVSSGGGGGDSAGHVADGTRWKETKYVQSCVWLAFVSESANSEEPVVDGRIN
jgi:hypothetical protein